MAFQGVSSCTHWFELDVPLLPVWFVIFPSNSNETLLLLLLLLIHWHYYLKPAYLSSIAINFEILSNKYHYILSSIHVATSISLALSTWVLIISLTQLVNAAQILNTMFFVIIWSYCCFFVCYCYSSLQNSVCFTIIT